jgi:hypothetical protein
LSSRRKAVCYRRLQQNDDKPANKKNYGEAGGAGFAAHAEDAIVCIELSAINALPEDSGWHFFVTLQKTKT